MIDLIKYQTLDSTNKEAKRLIEKRQSQQNFIVACKHQSSGKGQGTNIWYSEPNTSALFSYVKQTQIPIQHHFKLVMISSLAILHFLQKNKISAKIKWPNDIYVHDKKIAGILIENFLTKDFITKTIIGIGLNVNQSKFPAYLPNPTSLILESNKDYNIEKLITYINNKINDLYKINLDILHKTYLSELYKMGEFHQYYIKSTLRKAKILSVNLDGSILLEDSNNKQYRLLHNELKYTTQT